MEGTSAAGAPRPLTIAYVEGVTPGKWLRRWESRMPSVPLRSFQTSAADQLTPMRAGRADMSFIRLPADTAGLHSIPLYEEAAVVVMSRDDELTILDDVPAAELDGRTVLADDGQGFKALIELVATGVGVATVPMSIARLYSRKDVVFRPMAGEDGTFIALTWPKAGESAPVRTDDAATSAPAETDLPGPGYPDPGYPDPDIIEEFIGIVRGRTANSSRQPSARRKQERGHDPVRKTGKKSAGRKQSGGRRKPRRR